MALIHMPMDLKYAPLLSTVYSCVIHLSFCIQAPVENCFKVAEDQLRGPFTISRGLVPDTPFIFEMSQHQDATNNNNLYFISSDSEAYNPLPLDMHRQLSIDTTV